MVQKFKIPKFRPQKVFWPGPPPRKFLQSLHFGQRLVMAKNHAVAPDAKSAQSFGKNQLGAGPVS